MQADGLLGEFATMTSEWDEVDKYTESELSLLLAELVDGQNRPGMAGDVFADRLWGSGCDSGGWQGRGNPPPVEGPARERIQVCQAPGEGSRPD